MTPSTFFSRLAAFIKTFQIDGQIIFGDVKVVSAFKKSMVARMRFPGCLIIVGNYITDGEHPEIGVQRFQINFAVQNKQDVYGENVWTGSGTTLGLHQIAEKLVEALTSTTALADSVIIVEGSVGNTLVINNNEGIHMRLFTCESLLDGY